MTGNDVSTGGVNTTQVPLHRRIAENLTQQVTSGALKPGQKLPSERRIATQFNASRATVRTALQHLEQSGLITRRDRRSAIVAIRRDITPFMRIACSQSRILHLFRRLADMQLLPPRCHLQLLDLQQPEAIHHLLAQPTSGADILFCDLEYVQSLRQEKDMFQPLPQYLAADLHLQDPLTEMFTEEGKYQAIPFSLSPMVLYYNRALFRDYQLEPPTGAWQWEQLIQTAERFTGNGKYGFQFRPTFGHLTSLMTRRGGMLYQNGRVAAQNSSTFEGTVRFTHELLHEKKLSPLLAKVEQINLFAQRRCGMALDGFEMFGPYQEQLGDDLGVAALPGDGGGNITNGIVGLVLSGQENLQPIEDLLRALLISKTQLVLAQIGAGLPVRGELQNAAALQGIDIPTEVSDVFLSEARDFQTANLPGSLTHKVAVENLFLELWLGLDNLDSICQRFREL